MVFFVIKHICSMLEEINLNIEQGLGFFLFARSYIRLPPLIVSIWCIFDSNDGFGGNGSDCYLFLQIENCEIKYRQVVLELNTSNRIKFERIFKKKSYRNLNQKSDLTDLWKFPKQFCSNKSIMSIISIKKKLPTTYVSSVKNSFSFSIWKKNKQNNQIIW